MRLALCLTIAALAACVLAPGVAHAATKADEGFAAMLITDGDNVEPRNRITRGHAGDDVIYWIKWKEPVPRTNLRCVVTGPNTNLDETEPLELERANGFSVCPIETEDSDAGEYHFVQYLGSEKVGEGTITLEPLSFFKRATRRRRGFLIAAATALLVLGIYWIRRKATGDRRSLRQLARGESGAELAVDIAVATKGAASGLGPRKVNIGQAVAPPEPAEKLADFKKRLGVDAAHRPASAEEAWEIARAARKAGDTASAVAALRGFDKAFPGHSLIPEVYLFSARMMSETGNGEMARRIAQHIVQKYPGHFVAKDAKRLLESA